MPKLTAHLIYRLIGIMCFLIPNIVYAQIDAKDLLPATQAFQAQVINREQGLTIQFTIADTYYLYQSKFKFTTHPADIEFDSTIFSPSIEKTDHFFGKQQIFKHYAQIDLPYSKPLDGRAYDLNISFQGCAEVGICYPPTQTTFTINKLGVINANNNQTNINFLTAKNPKKQASSHFELSHSTLITSLLAFFIAGIGLSFTACMYPLLPIVSSIVVGSKNSSKKSAFILSFCYIQGLALSYATIGIIAGITGSLLMVWLQQAWVVLTAALFIFILALAMFGLINIQLPSPLQNYFQAKGDSLTGGKISSVFAMGIVSALIIGPCVAPPLAFTLAYIGSTGDALLGGLALYSMALGTGLPLIIIATFGSQLLPTSGPWMNMVRNIFGCILLLVAIYLATPFIPYYLSIAAYTLVLLIAAGLLLIQAKYLNGCLRSFTLLIALLLISSSIYFAYNSQYKSDTWLHYFLILTAETQQDKEKMFSTKKDLDYAIQQAFREDSSQIVLIDFYADWCISCKEMAMKTFSQEQLKDIINPQRFFQIDVTDNTPDQQLLLKEYGLFGPPGLFILHSPKQRTAPLLGFVTAEELIEWIDKNSKF